MSKRGFFKPFILRPVVAIQGFYRDFLVRGLAEQALAALYSLSPCLSLQSAEIEDTGHHAHCAVLKFLNEIESGNLALNQTSPLKIFDRLL